MDKEKTKVIFRQWKIGCEIIALFPEIATDTLGYNCQSFMHVGQHGAASPNIIKDTQPAILEDGVVKRLIKELIDRGYNLEIIKRFRYSHQQTRQKMYKKIEKKKPILRKIVDNKGKTRYADYKYIAYFSDGYMLYMSDKPLSSKGVCRRDGWTQEEFNSKDFGKETQFEELNNNVQKAITNYMEIKT